MDHIDRIRDDFNFLFQVKKSAAFLAVNSLTESR